MVKIEDFKVCAKMNCYVVEIVKFVQLRMKKELDFRKENNVESTKIIDSFVVNRNEIDNIKCENQIKDSSNNEIKRLVNELFMKQNNGIDH